MKNNRITIQFIAVVFSHLTLVLLTIYTTSTTNSITERILTTYLSLFSLIVFYKTWKTNPAHFTNLTEKKRTPQALVLGNNTIVNTYSNGKTILREIATKDGIFVERYCSDCNTFKNKYITHCRFCDKCIPKRDHHCSWLDTCIAEKNIEYFILCIVSIVCMTTYTILRLKFDNIYLKITIKSLLASISLIFTLMCVYYLFLAIIGMTSAEFLKKNNESGILTWKNFINFISSKKSMPKETNISEYNY